MQDAHLILPVICTVRIRQVRRLQQRLGKAVDTTQPIIIRTYYTRSSDDNPLQIDK